MISLIILIIKWLIFVESVMLKKWKDLKMHTHSCEKLKKKYEGPTRWVQPTRIDLEGSQLLKSNSDLQFYASC